MIRVKPTALPEGHGVEVSLADHDGDELGRADRPVRVDIFDGTLTNCRGTSSHHAYDEIRVDASGWTGTVRTTGLPVELEVTDRWTDDGKGVHLQRHVRCLREGHGLGFRVGLELGLGCGFGSDAQLFAPPAVYNLNDIDGDGVDDYLDTRELVFRDDRLSGLAVLAYSPSRQVGVALTRDDLPNHDAVPKRVRGQQAMLQTTDIGSLGIVPQEEGWAMVAAYPFVEYARSHALTAKDREPWGAFLPCDQDAELTVTYGLDAPTGSSATDVLWTLWRERARRLAPRRVDLPLGVQKLSQLRLEAMLPYYRESEAAAGFVTNCHPQDGQQLGDILQYGFTGQSVLNGLHVLNHATELDDTRSRIKGLRTIESFVRRAGASPFGLTRTLHDFDSGRDTSWWSGLLLPLAYADEGADLQQLMGPVFDHMRGPISALSNAPDGTYLRCMAEEHHAVLRAYQAERERGCEHPQWLAVAKTFGRFLLERQERDGSWRRAYDFEGAPLVEPREWFGPNELNQKSSTATVVPFLYELHKITGAEQWADAAVRAASFVTENYVNRIAFNGGIHDSIYARPQLVDSESFLFALRACLAAWELSGDRSFKDAARDAGRLLATWVYLWDVPLPPESTLAKHSFRSTGWSACDTAGAGYIHPYELHAVPDLMDTALLCEDRLLAEIADLVLHGSNETVATPHNDWGYARYGLQEEGVLVSWWLIDDPMFADTAFGNRGKGEGNKTCLPWISAVGIDATDEVIRRYGTTDLLEYWQDATTGAAH